METKKSASKPGMETKTRALKHGTEARKPAPEQEQQSERHAATTAGKQQAAAESRPLKAVVSRAAFFDMMREHSHAIVDGEFALMDALDREVHEKVRKWYARKLARASLALFSHCFERVDKKTGAVSYGDVPGVMAVPASEHYVLHDDLVNDGPKLSFPMVATWADFAFDVSVPVEYVPFRRMLQHHPQMGR